MSDHVPCQHFNAMVGTVSAGATWGDAFCSVSTCPDCVEKSRGYVQMKTGLQPTVLLTFEEYRSQKGVRS